MNCHFKINEFVLGGPECYIIAEIGQAHDGSLGSAYAYIDAVAEAGVNAVKFQTHIASEESTRHEQFRVKVFPQDETRYDYWKRMEFTPEQWQGLADYARSKGLDFLSTPFSIAAVELLDKLNVPAFKVGSGDTSNETLLRAMIETGKPILLSSGMSAYEELEQSVSMITSHGVECAVFQCTTSYPCAAEDIGYNVIQELRQKYPFPIGLSDHSGTIYPSIAAVALGAKLIEVHAVFSKRCFGPDTKSSLTIEELAELVKGIRFVEKGLNSPVDKAQSAESRKDTKVLFSRSAFFKKPMAAGDTLTPESFSLKKPGGGLTYQQANALVGKTLKLDKNADDFLYLEDFE
ncbi:N-acetylneuraminate synthase family protein [Vibrio vulnificus]|uniref:N-acetylneuraminate synthase family protein n=1 Tax=Vibrio vulnificus TaxID=672 RepID=UPI003ED8D16D